MKIPDERTKEMDQNNLVIDRKSASRMSAVALFIGFFIFITGYFIGKRRAMNEFMVQMEKESLTDQVYSAASALYESPADSQVGLDEAPDAPEESLDTPVAEEASVEPPAPSSPSYYAQLASFRRHQDAQPLVNRLKKHGIITEIREITSKSRQGRAIKWYQVITPSYTDKKDLDQLAGTIKKLEKINDIAIKKEHNS